MKKKKISVDTFNAKDFELLKKFMDGLKDLCKKYSTSGEYEYGYLGNNQNDRTISFWDLYDEFRAFYECQLVKFFDGDLENFEFYVVEED